MTTTQKSPGGPRETPLEEGLRRFAPKKSERPRVALSEFAISLLLFGRGSDPHSQL